MAQAIHAGSVDQFPDKQGVCITHEEATYAVFKIGDRFFACDGRCPHAGGPLHDGFLRGTEIVCPWHGWNFELDTGDKDLRDGVLRYPVTIEDGQVYIQLPDGHGA